MNEYPLISIIIPSYNHQKYILQALESVFQQTYQPLELIFLDDCSRDETFSLAEQWGKLPRVRDRFARLVIQRNSRNMGAHATINAALEMAQGEWLTILNSDDWYAPERMEKLLATVLRCKKQHAFTRVTVVDAEGSPLRNSELAVECLTMADRLEACPSIGFVLLEKNAAITSGNLFFSRSLYRQVGPFSALKYTHDWDFLLRCLAVEEPAFVPDPLYFYRIYEGNTFHKLKKEKIIEPQIIYRRYFITIKNRNFQNEKYPLYKTMMNMDGMKTREKFLGKEIPDYNSIANNIERSTS